MMRRFLLLLLCFTIQHAYAGVFETLPGISSAEDRLAQARRIYFTQGLVQKGETFGAAFTELLALSKQLQDTRLEAFALVMQLNYNLRYEIGVEDSLLKNLSQVGGIARTENDLVLQVDYLHLMGMMQYRLKNFEPAFEYLLKAHDLITKHGDCTFPYASVYLYELGLYYYRFLDYGKAISLIQQSTECGPPTPNDLLNNYNTLALAKRQQGEYSDALNYFARARTVAITLHDSAWYGIITGNMGSVYYKMNRLEKALPLLQEDFELSIAHEEWSSAILGMTTIARIYLLKNNPAAARVRIHLLDTIFQKTTDNKVLYQYYETKAGIEKAYHHYQTAYTYLDSSHYFQQLFLQLNNPVITKMAEQKMQIENSLFNIQLLESKRKEQVITRNAIIVASLLLLIIAGQFIYRQKQRQRRHLESIQTARYQLKNYIENLREKNLLIEACQREIEQLQKASAYPAATEPEKIKARLQTFTILTEDDWQEFKHLYEQVYYQFFTGLENRYPGLTQSEMRLIALNKLNLSKKEMAEMLGVSPDAIRKTRQRIRYKLLLPDDKSLEELLQTI